MNSCIPRNAADPATWHAEVAFGAGQRQQQLDVTFRITREARHARFQEATGYESSAHFALENRKRSIRHRARPEWTQLSREVVVAFTARNFLDEIDFFAHVEPAMTWDAELERAVVLALPFVTGMVGLGRYAGETFPPFVAAGEILRRWPRAGARRLRRIRGAQAVCAYWVIYLDYLP